MIADCTASSHQDGARSLNDTEVATGGTSMVIKSVRRQGAARVLLWCGIGAVIAPAAYAQAPAAAPGAGAATANLETVLVTGSHIPRVQAEGPAPVTAITAADIRANGYATMADVMSALTQNLGALDNNQNTNGFTPGAQAVDLRGLGPNHTLVLVNGRRMASYPQSYGGNSNFTDISNIPVSMVERVEVLSGSASAIYGSDAIAGVINFILKQHVEETTVDLRLGNTQHGGGTSERFALTSGYNNGPLEAVFGVELYNQQPVWAYQRSFTDSRQDSPADPSRIYASPVFTRLDGDDNYIDPGKATCDRLSALDHGSIVYAYRRNYGYYCGSYKDVGYGTLQNGRKSVNAYGSGTYKLSDQASIFLDVQAGGARQTIYNTPLQWQNSYPLNGGSADIPFFNSATGQVEQWQRKYFTIEENGGFDAGEIHNDNRTFSVNTGLKGALGTTAWNYEALVSYSQNTLENREPALVAAKATSLYLGSALGIDTSSGAPLTIYNADPSRLYTPLTVAQFRSITRNSVDNDKSRAAVVALSLTNSRLWSAPGGPVGFAGLIEYGSERFENNVDPASLDGTYYGLHNTSATGSRKHGGAGVEFSVPVTSALTVTAAGRYDNYSYSGTSSGKVTYSTGIEYRPVRNLLLRGSYGTGFRAPDLSYLYAGPSGSSSGGIDYYLCRRDEAASGPDFANNCSNGDVGFNGRSNGSTALKDETSTSLTYGFVFTPVRGLDIAADYYQIRLANEVEYQSSDLILREEADCRLGKTQTGQVVDSQSALCQAVLGQVVRNPVSSGSYSEAITSVLSLPINAAVDRTTGVDINVHYAFGAGPAGRFDINAGVTDVLTHTIQLFPGDAVVNELTDWYEYVIPRWKAGYSVAWTLGPVSTTVHASLLGGLPNYDGTERLGSTQVYSASVTYRPTDRATVTLNVNNLLDTKPARDHTWTSYPYYPSSWFSPIGRAFFVQMSYGFGRRN